jgi:sugar-specific transcriptional regulator TrmB
MSSVEGLVKIGLNQNEAKALDALIMLGPVGASDVHKYAGIPRNKAYESLEKLASQGMVEVQQGRPTLYRAIGAKAVIDSLLENYAKDAKDALSVLEKKQEDLRMSAEESSGESAYAWLVRGEMGVKRRLAELIFEAKNDIFSISGYPPKYMLAAKSALKAAAKKGITVRPVCMVRPMQSLDEKLVAESSVIEFRTVKTSPNMRMQPHDEKLIGSFTVMPPAGAMVVIDENVAYDIVDEGGDPKKASAIVLKSPGVPSIQKATVERILALYTRKI